MQELAFPVRFIQGDWYGCRRAWKELKHLPFDCPYLKSLSLNGQIGYTRFLDGYRNYGPVMQNSIIYRELKAFRTAIGQDYGLIKENRKYKYLYGPRQCPYARYRACALTRDIIFLFERYGKISLVINPNY